MDTFPNIKFANNIHSYGGYFMWAPGAYKNDGFRTTSPAPNIGIEKYFFEAGENILGASRTRAARSSCRSARARSPTCSTRAAGNSADDAWYRKGIISYSFETGADRILNTTTGTRRPRSSASSRASRASAPVAARAPARPTARSSNEGRDEALEFAAGNFGLVESAYAYGKDVTAADGDLDSDGVTQSKDPINYRFNDGQRAVGHPLHDGRLDADPVVADLRGAARPQRRPGPDDLSTPGATRSSGWRSTSRATSRRSSPRRVGRSACDATTPGSASAAPCGATLAADAGRSGAASARSRRASPRCYTASDHGDRDLHGR